MDDVSNTVKLSEFRDPDKPRRRYDSTRRRAAADRTRVDVLDAGERLLLSRGYARTTMREVAAEAGVAVESVYSHFRSKPALLTALMDRAHGASADTPIAERDWVAEVRTAGSPGEQLDALAANLTAVHGTLAPLRLALRRAADADDTAAELARARDAERLEGLGRLAERLRDAGAVRADAAVDEVRDVLFALTSAELYGLLVLDRGWPPERFATWLARALRDQLLGTEP